MTSYSSKGLDQVLQWSSSSTWPDSTTRCSVFGNMNTLVKSLVLFHPKLLVPFLMEINTVPPDMIPNSDWNGDEMLLTSLDGTPSSRVFWKTFCACERALRVWFPLRQQSETQWDSACYLGQVGLQPSSERPSCLLLQNSLPFNRLPRRMWKRPFWSTASRPFTGVYRAPPSTPPLTQPSAVLLVGTALLPALA